jgi:hypothetical protein
VAFVCRTGVGLLADLLDSSRYGFLQKNRAFLCHVVRISYKVKVAQLVLFVVSKNKP